MHPALGPVVRLYIATHVICTATPYVRYGYHHYFTEEEIPGTERVSDLLARRRTASTEQSLVSILLSQYYPVLSLKKKKTVLITTTKAMLKKKKTCRMVLFTFDNFFRNVFLGQLT